MSEAPVTFKKFGFVSNISADALEAFDHERFPQKGHIESRPWTEDELVEYATLAERWKAVEAEWAQIQQHAEQRNWGSGVGGYDYEAPVLNPLPEKHTKWVEDETHEEWRARLAENFRYHRETGEWLFEPRPTFWERVMAGSFTDDAG